MKSLGPTADKSKWGQHATKLLERNGVVGRMKGTFQRVSFQKRIPKASRPEFGGRDGDVIGEDEVGEVRSRGVMHTCRKRDERERERDR